MEFRIYKIYNRATHSFLAVLEAEATGVDEDPNIFVCRDRAVQTGPELPSGSSCPVEEESSSSEESLSESSSSEVSSE